MASAVLGALLAALLAACGATSGSSGAGSAATASSGAPGTIVSSTPISGAPTGSRGWRIVYRTTTASGAPAVSSGTVYVPTGPAPAHKRLVVAWAHPTLGYGSDCTPSRATDPAADIPGFAALIAKGWVITSSDYTGLGTPGTLPYLIGAGEAHDVIDSVRAADNLAGADAGTTYAVWGHSQGGHASLFTGDLAARYAPSLHLVGVAAAAPAAELPSLIALQWQGAVAWVIGSEVVELWPHFYPELQASAVTTPLGLANAAHLGAVCITSNVGDLLKAFGPYITHPFFSVDPATVPTWRARIDQNTPTPPAKVPVFVAQGLDDTVVLPATTAQLEASWCKAGSPLTVDWYPTATHFTVPAQSAAATVSWLAARFAGTPAPTTCGQTLPVAPATDPPST